MWNCVDMMLGYDEAMMTAARTKPERFDLSVRPAFDEKWVQRIIAADSTVLGRATLVLREQERVQTSYTVIALLDLLEGVPWKR